MSLNKNTLSLYLLIGLIAGCVTETNNKTIQPVSEPVEAQEPVKEQAKEQVKAKADITEADFKRAVRTAVKNMLQSGALDNPNGGRYVIAVSSIVDTTKKGFNTADIKQKLRENLASGRKARVVNASSKTVEPQMIVAGRITQRTAYVRGGQRQEYYLHLVLTEAKSGLKLWENSTPVVRKTN